MTPSIAAIARVVELTTGIRLRRNRHREVVRARWLVFWVAEQYGYSLMQIARHFELDHTTVLHGLRKIHAELVGGAFAGESRQVMRELQEARRCGA